jgi:hypothetical protein
MVDIRDDGRSYRMCLIVVQLVACKQMKQRWVPIPLVNNQCIHLVFSAGMICLSTMPWNVSYLGRLFPCIWSTCLKIHF